MKNRQFIAENFNFLFYGLIMAACTSAGQTFYIGIFKGDITAAYDLTDSAFGSWYLIITLVSAFCLNQFGPWLDHIPLKKWTAALFTLMTVGCLILFLLPGFAALVIGLMLVRLVGQGLMFHTSMTTMNRYFDKRRGLALSIAVLGIPLGQAFFPPLAAYLKIQMGWQESWGVLAGLYCLFLMPAALYCLKGFDRRHQIWQENLARLSKSEASTTSFTRQDMVKDPRFYLLMPAIALVPFWGTAAFFFVEDITTAKGWDLIEFTQLYWITAMGAVAAPFLGGNLVDRVGGIRSQLIYPPVLMLAFAVLNIGTSQIAAGLFLCLIGVTMGLVSPINNAIWAELYGTKYLAAVKSLVTSIAVVLTALAPFLVGILLDRGFTIQNILNGAILHGVVAMLLLLAIRKR